METEQFDVAGIGCSQAFADFDRGCFSRAIGTEKAKALAGVNLEVEAVDGDHVLIGLAKTTDAESWFGGGAKHETSIASGGYTCKTRTGWAEKTGSRLSAGENVSFRIADNPTVIVRDD